MQLYVILAELK